MLEHGSHILLDTNVIIEATRTNCWKALADRYRLDTVDKCVEECATGNQRKRNPVPVDTTSLAAQLKPKKVGYREMARLFAQCPLAEDLDDGEKELLAYAITLKNIYFVSSADRKCVRVGFYLSIIDSFVSLEELAHGAGISADFRDNHTAQWLSRCRTELKLESLGT